MSELDQLATLISNILQHNDEALRKKSEQTLVSLRNERSNELMTALIGILESKIYQSTHLSFPSFSSFIYLGQYPTDIRKFSAFQIRLCLSNLSPSTFTEVWTKLTA